MAEVADAPVAKEEVSHRQDGISRWMAGLQESLPNPSLGAGTEPPADPPVEPADTPPPAEPPAPAPVVPEAPQQPATPAPEPATPPAQEPTGEEKWPRSAKEWKNFTTARKVKDEEFKKQIAERDTKIKELEAKTAQPVSPEVQKELDSLKKENDDFSKQLRLLAVTQHPRFRSYFDNKVVTTLNQLKACVSPEQMDSVVALVKQPDSEMKSEKINELLTEMTPLKQGRFLGVINGLAAIDAEREGEIARAQTDYEEMMSQAKAQQDAQKANFTKLLDGAITAMQSTGGRPEYQMREGQTEWNESVKRRVEAGRSLIAGNLPPEAMFKAAFDAAAYADVVAGYRETLQELDKLKKQVAAMTAANPTIQSPRRTESTNGTGTEAAPVMPKDSRPMDYTKQWVKRFGDVMQGGG